MKEAEAARKAELDALFKPVIEKKQVVSDSMCEFKDQVLFFKERKECCLILYVLSLPFVLQ